jgi:DNA ligase-1
MEKFTQLYLQLDQTTRTSEKLEALANYFRSAPPQDAIWAVYLMTGRKIGRTISFRLLRDWVGEISQMPTWMVDECYTLVGDLSETLSLLLGDAPGEDTPPTLHNLVEQTLRPLAQLTQPQQRDAIQKVWQSLTQPQKLVLHKLLSREFRIGVSRQLIIRALAQAAGVDAQIIAHRLAGNWTPDAATMARILSPETESPNQPRDPSLPYPFMLAHPLADPPDSLGSITDWLLEWKWDGIRAQIIHRGAKVTIWSRGDEVITSAFPEIVQAAQTLPDGTVLDGEIVAFDENTNRPMSFAKLQPRINRKNVEPSFWPDVPIAFIAFDLLELAAQDLRSQPLADRRRQLTDLLKNSPPIFRLSTPPDCQNWTDVAQIIAQSRDRAVEGLMIKRWDSPYRAGRPTGLWWKLKVQPYTLDCVLIAAQSGHGRRAGLLTDYTFGLWDDARQNLIPFAKAYSGLTDEEILEVDSWVRRHTTQRHGPVHTVEPLRVFELGFEAIQRSTRHKSGLAVRFPRMLKQRPDKKPQDADSLASLRELLEISEAR